MVQLQSVGSVGEDIPENKVFQLVGGSHAPEIQGAALERKTRKGISVFVRAVTGVITVIGGAGIINIFDEDVLHGDATADHAAIFLKNHLRQKCGDCVHGTPRGINI